VVKRSGTLVEAACMPGIRKVEMLQIEMVACGSWEKRCKRYKTGDYQQSFSTHLDNATEVKLGRQPNLERQCSVALPAAVLRELHQQVVG
jgi:hypothetical protein